MKYKLISIIFFCLLLLPHVLSGWGFWAHRKINEIAVFSLPPDMLVFYKGHIDFLSEHAVDPDKRRYALKDEAPRHYIDLDHYDVYPFDSIPRYWGEAVEKFSEDTLMKHGIVPWHVQTMVYRLTAAFRSMNADAILKISADMGHYIADAHVPLHTTTNYNGQLTDQKGIHGFWESRLPELFNQEYDLWVGQAEYIDDPLAKIWEIILESNLAVDSVCLIEKSLNQRFDGSKKYVFDERGVSSVVKTYSKEYSKAYHTMLNGMVERRMRAAMLNVANFWYTAWVNARSPDLSAISKAHIEINRDSTQIKLEQKWRLGKILGRRHAD